MNSAQVRGKARAAMAKREDEIEEEEIQGGEINLVPYLDIVTNLMLFLLASVSSGFILGQIDTTLPNHSSSASKPAVDPKEKPDEQPLVLTVSVTKTELRLWSVSSLEGTLAKPKMRAGLLAESTSSTPVYDVAKLNEALMEIATRRWAGKKRNRKTYEILLQADGDISYDTIITVMDSMRRPMLGGKKKPTVVLFPKFEIKDDKEVATENYDPKKHFLFVDVLFAKPGFD